MTHTQVLDPTDSQQLEAVQRLLYLACDIEMSSVAVRSPAALETVLASVLCSAGCCELLCRLSALQAQLDRFDVEAVCAVYERLQRQHGPQLSHTLWLDTAKEDQQSAPHTPTDCHRQPQQQLEEHAYRSAKPHCARDSSLNVSSSSFSAPPLSVDEWAADLTDSACGDIVRDYLVAHTLKDCSIILDIAATRHRWTPQDERNAPQQLHGWQCDSDERLSGVYAVQVIDLDRKHAHDIPRYAQLDADIAAHYCSTHAQTQR